MDEVDAQAMLPVLLRSLVPHTEPGLPVGGRGQPGRRQDWTQCRAKNQGQSRR